MRKSQIGFNLLEVLLAVFVAAAIIFTVVRYFTIGREGARVVQAAQLIKVVSRASYDWVEGHKNFTGLGPNGIQTLVNGNFLPRNFSSGVINPWRGAIQVQAAPGDIHRVQIILTNVPLTACTRLSEQLKQQGTVQDCTSTPNQFVGVF